MATSSKRSARNCCPGIERRSTHRGSVWDHRQQAPTWPEREAGSTPLSVGATNRTWPSTRRYRREGRPDVTNGLHDDEIRIDTDLVSRLINTQFPQFAALPLRRLDAFGSTNVLFRSVTSCWCVSRGSLAVGPASTRNGVGCLSSVPSYRSRFPRSSVSVSLARGSASAGPSFAGWRVCGRPRSRPTNCLRPSARCSPPTWPT